MRIARFHQFYIARSPVQHKVDHADLLHMRIQIILAERFVRRMR